MPVVRVLVDECIGARIRVKRVRTHEMRAGELVPEMAVNRVNEKQFAVLVPIMPPRVGSSRTDYLYNLAPRVITPHRAAQRNALLRGRTGQADLARTGRAAAAIKPPVRTETQAVREGMVHIRRTSEAA